MKLFTSTLNQMGFLALLVVIGFLLVKLRVMPGIGAGILSKLENNVFIPALVMGTFMNQFTVETFRSSGVYLLCGAVVVMITVPLAILFSRCLTRDRYLQGIYTYGLAFSNFGFMGNAVVQALFPQVFLNYLIFVLPFWAGIYVWGVPFLLMPSGERKRGVWGWIKPFVNPMFIGMLVGLLLGITALPIPRFAADAVSTLGNCMSPVAMLLTGMTIAQIDLKKTFRNVPVYIASVIRLILIPLAAIGSVKFLGLAYSLALCVVCNLAMPLGLSPIVIPAAYGKDTSDAAGMVMISHLLSCSTIPVIFWLFERVVG